MLRDTMQTILTFPVAIALAAWNNFEIVAIGALVVIGETLDIPWDLRAAAFIGVLIAATYGTARANAKKLERIEAKVARVRP